MTNFRHGHDSRFKGINKTDGGKKRARRAAHKFIRAAGKLAVRMFVRSKYQPAGKF